MAFPTTGVLDDFNRASIGAGWTGIYNALAIISSTIVYAPTSADISYWNAATYGDCEVYVDVPTLPGAGGTISVLARLKDVGSVATFDGYDAALVTGTPDTLKIERITNGAGTTLASTTAIDFVAGDSLGLEVVGDTIKLYHKTGGVWYERLSTTDSTYPAAGYIGIGIISSSARGDNFGGGTYVAPTASFAQRAFPRSLSGLIVR